MIEFSIVISSIKVTFISKQKYEFTTSFKINANHNVNGFKKVKPFIINITTFLYDFKDGTVKTLVIINVNFLNMAS